MDATHLFLDGTKDNPRLNEVLEIVKSNSSGKIWLIGGFVYRTIASQLYGIPKPEVDFDFIVEKTTEHFTLPKDWSVQQNRFGNPKLVHENNNIDYVPLDKVYSITSRNLPPTIENFLVGVPLTIQSIAYDVYENQIIGEMGIDALRRRVIEVNDIHFAQYAASKKGISVEEMIKRKADSMRFMAVLK